MRSCRPRRLSNGKSRARRRRTGRSVSPNKPLADFWEARIARQKAIDASIASKAEFEFLYDRPYADPKTVRVAGPFTVESLSPHRTLGVDENDELIDPLQVKESGAQSFEQMILENLHAAGVQQAHKEGRITFESLTPWPGEMVCAEGRYREGDDREARRHLHRPRVRNRAARRISSPPPARPATPVSTC